MGGLKININKGKQIYEYTHLTRMKMITEAIMTTSKARIAAMTAPIMAPAPPLSVGTASSICVVVPVKMKGGENEKILSMNLCMWKHIKNEQYSTHKAPQYYTTDYFLIDVGLG